jgi:hypothetical protein
MRHRMEKEETMTKRAATRSHRLDLNRPTRRERDLRLGRAALALPRALVALVTAGVMAMAALGVVSTVALAG